MTDLVLDPVTGDLDVTDFIAPRLFTPGEQILEIAQRVMIRLRMGRGEWFADVNEGTPWFQEIIGVKGGDAVAEVVLRDRVLATPGVTAVDSLTVTLDADRLATVSLRAQTSAGPLDLSGVPLA